MASSRSQPAPKDQTAKKAPARRASTSAPAPRTGIVASHGADLVAVGLATLAILLALALWFTALGPVGHGLDRFLGDLLGWVRYLLPVLLLGVVALLVVHRDHVEASRLWVGGILAVLALCGIAGLTGGNPALSAPEKELQAAGGILGALIGHSLSRAVGTIGAGVLLAAVLVVAGIVATGVPIKDVLTAGGRGAKRAGSTAVAWWGGSSARRQGSGGDPGSAAEAPTPLVPAAAMAATVVSDDQPFDDEAVEPSAAESLTEPDAPLTPKRAKKAAKVMVAAGEWKLPPPELLKTSSALQADRRLVEQAGEDLVAALAAHGVVTSLIGSTVGPTVTRYELELGPGVKVARVTGLNKDIAYAMASPDVRILAPIPGRQAIGVEVPNRQRQLVTLGDLLISTEATEDSDPLSVALGRDIAGRTVMQSLAEFPHVLISGATGAGKSSAINSLITSLLMRTTPDQVKLILVDPKRVELGQYNDLPHLLTPVVVDPKKAANALSWAVKEMERRYDLLAAHHVRDITSYHEALLSGTLRPTGPPDDSKAIAAIAARARNAARGPFDADDVVEPELDEVAGDDELDPLPFIVVVVDELNDLMMVAARDVEESVVRIAQMARAVGIHLVLATQRPSVDVITGVIKANVPSRMAFSVSSLADSRVILDQPGAERLVGKGDMLLLTASSNVARRIQAPWVSEDEVRGVVSFWRAQGGQSEQVVAISDLEHTSSGLTGGASDDDDELLKEARRIVIDSQLGSTSMLQRKLRVGFARAGRLMDLLEQEGVVGPSTGSKAREVLISKDESAGGH